MAQFCNGIWFNYMIGHGQFLQLQLMASNFFSKAQYLNEDRNVLFSSFLVQNFGFLHLGHFCIWAERMIFSKVFDFETSNCTLLI